MNRRTIVKQWLCDSAIGFLLLVIAAAVSDVLHHFLTPQVPGAYAPWFSVCMIPFLLFARHRGAISFKYWELVAFLLFASFTGSVVSSFLRQK